MNNEYGVLMIFEVFISYTFSRLNKIIDNINAGSKEKEFVKIIVKEALLGCCVDWNTMNDFTRVGVLEAKLKRYAEMLNVVAVRFRASEMLSLDLYKQIIGYAREMMVISDKLELDTHWNSVEIEANEPFVNLKFFILEL